MNLLRNLRQKKLKQTMGMSGNMTDKQKQEEFLNSFITQGDFVIITNDKLEDDGLVADSRAYVVGTQQIIEDKEDPYTVRLKLIVAKVEEGGVRSDEFFMVDSKSLVKVGAGEETALRTKLEEDYPEPDEVAELEATKAVIH